MMLVNANIAAPRSVIVRPPRGQLRLETTMPEWHMNPTLLPPKASLLLTNYTPIVTTGIRVGKQGLAITTYPPAVFTFSPIAQTVFGLAKEDDFDRADSDTVGADYTERVGDFDILSNFVRHPSSSSAAGWLEVTGLTARVEWFMQVANRWQFNSVHSHFGFADWNGGSQNGYALMLDDAPNLIQLRKWTAGAPADLGSNASETMATGTWYSDGQMYVKAGAQEAYFKAGGTGSTVSAADTAHDAVSKRPFIHKLSSFSNNDWDDLIVCLSKNIVVSSLATGWKAKVRNAADAVVAEATESGGTATIDASLFGSATERVPSGGWPVLQITDGADVEQGTYDVGSPTFAGIYPGDKYTSNL